MKLTTLLLTCCLIAACSASNTCVITKVTDKIKTIHGEEARKYKTTSGKRWILSSEEWDKGDTIPKR